MRILGIDFGDTRIGIALSDPFGWTAQALETIYWKIDMEKPAVKIADIISKNNVDKIIIGFPRNMNGTVGPRGEKTEEFINILSSKTTLPIIKWDERLSTVSANRTMHELGVKTSKKKGIVDQIAAVYILQGFLDSLQNKKD